MGSEGHQRVVVVAKTPGKGGREEGLMAQRHWAMQVGGGDQMGHAHV